LITKVLAEKASGHLPGGRIYAVPRGRRKGGLVTEEEMKAKLEKLMLEEFDGLFWLKEDAESGDSTAPWFVLVGDPHGCVPASILGEDLCQDIWGKFACYIRPVRALAAELLGMKYWEIDMAIDPSYEGYSRSMLYHKESMKVLLEVVCKSWNFFWKTKEELLEKACSDTLAVVAAMQDLSPCVWQVTEADLQSTAEDDLKRRLGPEELAFAKEVFIEGMSQYKDDIIWRAVEAAGRMGAPACLPAAEDNAEGGEHDGE
jgi:hypothetical protein